MRTVKQSYTLSGVAYGEIIALNGMTITAIQCPATLTSTTLNVKCSVDGITFGLMKMNGNNYTIPVTQGTGTKIDPNDFAGMPFVQFAPAISEATSRLFWIALTEL